MNPDYLLFVRLEILTFMLREEEHRATEADRTEGRRGRARACVTQ